jgi:tetratricopeptide (TPR) repeat protein
MSGTTSRRSPTGAGLVALAALALAALALAGAPRAAADDLKDGRTALQAGRYDEAIRSFERAAQQGLAAGRAGVGQVWLRRRQYDKAMEAFQIAEKMDPQLALPYYGQAEVLRRQERCQDALPLFEKATTLDRKFPEAQLGKGDCLVKTRQFEQGILALSEGLKWGPKWRPRFLVALGTAEMSRDSLRAAGIYFTKAREEAPGDPEVRRALGDFYVQRGTWALAVTETQAAVALDSTDLDLRFSLAQALYYDKRYDEALEQYEWITSREPDYAPGQLALGNLLYLAGAADARRYVEARPALERYTRMMPRDPRGWSLLGRTFYSLRQRDEGLAAMEKAVTLGEKSKEMYTMMGRAYAERRDFDKALAAFANGEPGSKEHLLIGQIYVFQNRLAEADSLYRAIMERDSSSVDGRFAMTEMGKLRFRQRDYEGTVGLLERRIALDPSHGETYYYLGLSLKELKRYPEATAALAKAAAIDTAKADRFFWLGVLNDQQKAIPEARQAFERSVALDDSSKLAGKAHRQLGFYLLLDKDWLSAIRRLERAVELDSLDVQAWVWLGQGYQNSGNREKAMQAYRRALALDPNQPEANKGVKVLSGGATSVSKGG